MFEDSLPASDGKARDVLVLSISHCTELVIYSLHLALCYFGFGKQSKRMNLDPNLIFVNEEIFTDRENGFYKVCKLQQHILRTAWESRIGKEPPSK